MNYKESSVVAKCQKYEGIAKMIEEMYKKYSDLGKTIVNQKKNETVIFDEYINACQEKEKTTTDIELEISNQNTKIKLLHETLMKRNQEHNKVLERNKKFVLFPLPQRNLNLLHVKRKLKKLARRIRPTN